MVLSRVPVCRGASMWFDLPESPAQLAFLLFHFQFNTNLGTYSLCWVTRRHSINVLFEVKYILKNSNHPRSGWFSWNLVQSDVESDLFSASYQSSVKQLLYLVLCPRGHQIPLRSLAVPSPGGLVAPMRPPVCTCKARTLKARDSTPKQSYENEGIILALMTEKCWQVFPAYLSQAPPLAPFLQAQLPPAALSMGTSYAWKGRKYR